MRQQIRRIITQPALPNDEYLPTQISQLGLIGGVAGDVAVQLLVPKLRIRSRSLLPLAAGMPVPEAALNKYGGLVSPQHQVGRAGQLADIQTITKALMPDGVTNKPLRSRAAIADTRHKRGAAFFRQEVSHVRLIVVRVAY